MAIESVEVSEDPDAFAPKPTVPTLADWETSPALPADFPANAFLMNDGSGAFLLKMAYPKALKFRQPNGEITTEPFSELVLNRLNGKSYRAVREASAEMFRPTVLSVMSGLTLGRAKLLEEAMDVSDMAAVLSVFRFFTTPGRRTGP